MTTNCKEEENDTNKITRKKRTNFEGIPHRNRNKKRKKLNLTFQVRGKYIRKTSVESGKNILSSGYNVSIKFDKQTFICPSGFIPRKNRCGKKTLILFLEYYFEKTFLSKSRLNCILSVLLEVKELRGQVFHEIRSLTKNIYLFK